jgi:pimeloyl-ACP methyl ester carboxylesterase
MPLTGVTHGVVKTPEADIHYVEAGQGPPVVLLHGWPQHLLSWGRVIPRLAERHRVIAVDLRGSGGSSITRGGYDKKTMAGDIRALVQHLELGPVSLVGNDHGAGVAYAYAAQHPAEVERLAIIEYWMAGFGYEQFLTATPEWSTATNWQLVLFTLPDVAEWLCRGKERELLAWFFWHAAVNPHAIDRDDFETYVRDYSRPGALRAGIEYYAAVWTDMADNKAFSRTKLPMPVLGIGGAGNGAEHVAEALKPLADQVSTAVVPGAGHWPTDENPEALAAILLESLR